MSDIFQDLALIFFVKFVKARALLVKSHFFEALRNCFRSPDLRNIFCFVRSPW